MLFSNISDQINGYKFPKYNNDKKYNKQIKSNFYFATNQSVAISSKTNDTQFHFNAVQSKVCLLNAMWVGFLTINYFVV